MGLLDWIEDGAEEVGQVIESGINTVGDAVESGLTDLEHGAGEIIDDGAHLLGEGLDAVGAHGAAQTVDNFGDNIADHLGAQVAEAQLGETDDPTKLIHGDVSAINQTATQLDKFATAFGETASGLKGIDTADWQGDAAETFRQAYSKHPQQWDDAQGACAGAAKAWHDYAGTVHWAQGQASEAINLYNQGNQASKQAGPGASPDPGAQIRQQAHETLNAARQQRDSAAQQAQTAISNATSTAPAEPSFSRRMFDDAADLGQGYLIGEEHLLGGIIKGAFGIFKFARALNPLDSYNITHPAQYLDGLSSTAAGLLHASNHPVDLVQGLVGTGWGSDPFEAAGRLLPAVALAAATDGAGAAEGVAAREAVGVGERAAEEGAAISENAGGLASRDPENMAQEVHPVEVAGGRVLETQTDAELAGILPLVLSRTYLSSYRVGRWFGPSWASTLDQRLEIEDTGVYYAAEGGMLLSYPPPTEEMATLPEEGPRWPLHRTEDGGYTITDPQRGRTLHFAPTSASLSKIRPLRGITDRLGHRIDLDYHPDGTLTDIRHSGGYHIGVEITNGRITALRLKDSNNTAAINADVVLVHYGYDQERRLTEVTNSSGIPLRFNYDTDGRLTGWHDRNNINYRYTYDQTGRCVRTSGADGCLNGTFAYDTGARVTVFTNSLGYDTTYHFNERGQVIRRYDQLGRVTISAWNRHDQLLARTDPLGRTTRCTYDQAGNLTEITRPDGHQTRAEYNDLHLPTKITDPDGATWRRNYDQRGNLTAVTDPLGATTRYIYDEQGHLVSITDALGHVRRVETDAAGLLTAVTDPLGATTRYNRDDFGRVTAVTDPVGGVTRFGWTTEGKLAWRALPDGATEHWSYDGEGNLVEHIDALGQTTRTEIGPFDLPTAQIGPDGARLEFCYDTELRLTAVTNPQGLIWRYTYDPAGNLLSETDFNSRVLTYVHDAAGQLIERTNGAGQTTTFTRDQLGNTVEQRSGDALTTFAYDPASRIIRATNADAELVFERDALGQVLAETCNGRTLTSAYDALGRRTHRRTASGVESVWEYGAGDAPLALHTAGYTLRFSHDPAGREIERHLGAGTVLVQAWDANHRLTSQTLTTDGLGLGPPSSAREAQLIQHRSYRYRADGYVTTIDDHLSGLRRFDLDPAGRVTRVRGAGWTERYAYDPAGNITHAAWPAPSQSDSVDVASQGGREYTGTLIRRAGSVRYQHDAQGRVILRQQKRLSAKPHTWRYTWDADDRLVGVITPDGTHWCYRYDPLGRRIIKQRLGWDGKTTAEQVDFTWYGSQLIEQHHSTAHVTTTWDYALNEHRPVSQLERVVGDGPSQPAQEWFDQRFYAIVTDLIGTPTELVDVEGVLAWHVHATVWGAALAQQAGHARTPLRMPGQYFDPETKLHYNYRRYYDSTTGRYLSSDPLGLAPAPSPYVYVDNPTRWTDPLGLMKCETENALRDWQSQRYQFGNQQLLMDKSDMAHILERHHPEFWDGSVRDTQSFFPSGTSIGRVQDLVSDVLRQNREKILSDGANGISSIYGVVDGVTYKLGINRGHIGQFFPVAAR